MSEKKQYRYEYRLDGEVYLVIETDDIREYCERLKQLCDVFFAPKEEEPFHTDTYWA
jgi:hypothetical protein